MQLTIYRDETGFAALKPQWNTLLARSRFDTLFLTWEWQTAWWRCLGEGELCLLAWRQDDDLVAIAPLYVTEAENGRRCVHIVGCIEVSDYVDLIVAAGYEEAIFASLLDWLLGPDAPTWDELDFCNLPQVSLTYQLLPEVAAGRGLPAITHLEDVCPIIELPGDWESYLSQRLDKKQRHEVRRKLRKIEREVQIHWYVVDATCNLAAEAEAFIQLHKLSKAEKHEFMTPEMEGFFHELIQVMYQAGWLHLAFLDIDGQKAAAMLSFIYKGRLLVYNSGYDPHQYAELSPGIVLTSYVIRDAIERGCHIFDFLQGDEVYKYRFGATDTAVYRTRIRRTVSAQASTG